MKIEPRWLRLTEESNALDYLEKASFFIKQTESDNVAWKWVIISLHGALYGFAICACKGTNPERVIDFKRRHKTIQKLEKLPKSIQKPGFPNDVKLKYNSQLKRLEFIGSMPDNVRRKLLKLSNDNNYKLAINKLYSDSHQLISFNRALDRCQNPNFMRMTIMSKELQLTDEQKDSIDILKKEFRNNIEHYIPKAWSIEIHGMPIIAIDVLNVIRFLAIETGNYIQLRQTQIRRLKSLVFQSKKFLRNSTLYKEASEKSL